MFLDSAVSKLPVKLQPYAKACVPFVTGAAAAGADLALSGAELHQLAVLAGGAVTGLLVAAIPNKD